MPILKDQKEIEKSNDFISTLFNQRLHSKSPKIERGRQRDYSPQIRNLIQTKNEEEQAMDQENIGNYFDTCENVWNNI